jgi:uncharacterized protein (TIGR03435 family)
MLYYAYGVAGNEISAQPWLATNKFDITAKIPPGTTKPQFAVMLQNLLAERFHLVVHHEQKEVDDYAMVIGKNGPKLTPASAADTAAATQPPSGPALSGIDEKGYIKLAGPGMIYPLLQNSNGKAIHLIARAQLLNGEKSGVGRSIGLLQRWRGKKRFIPDLLGLRGGDRGCVIVSGTNVVFNDVR